MHTGQIHIYSLEDGQTKIEVKLENETIWLTQNQIVDLFNSSKANVSEHIKHIYDSGELDAGTTVRKFRTVRQKGKRTVNRELVHYNLDIIISIGYRVNSLRGTQFRIWANKILKDFLVQGYAINEKRLKEQTEQLVQLKQTVKLLGNIVGNQELTSDEATGLLKVITEYTYALDVLDKYDHQILEIESTTSKELFQITYEEAMEAIDGLRKKFGGRTLFGNQNDDSFQGSLATIYQTIGDQYVYPSIEEKAANLLYFVTRTSHLPRQGYNQNSHLC